MTQDNLANDEETQAEAGFRTLVRLRTIAVRRLDQGLEDGSQGFFWNGSTGVAHLQVDGVVNPFGTTVTGSRSMLESIP